MEYIQLLSASLTPLIAIVTTYIAIQQYRSNRAKLRHDLYDKRMSIYKAASRFVALCKTEHGPTYELYTEFHLTIKESPFLFDTDLAEYLDNLEQQEDFEYLSGRVE